MELLSLFKFEWFYCKSFDFLDIGEFESIPLLIIDNDFPNINEYAEETLSFLITFLSAFIGKI